MQSQQKFTFDTEFLAEGDRPAPSALGRQRRTLTVDELETVKADARSEGETGAAARNAEAVQQALAALTIAVRAVADISHAEIETVRAEAAAIALAAARKLAPAAIAALPHAEVKAALREAMHQAIGEPRLVLRAAPDIAALIEPRLADIALEEGYDGRVQLVADPHVKGADCRIEWRGGGAERNFDHIESCIAEIIERRFSQSSSTTVKG